MDVADPTVETAPPCLFPTEPPVVRLLNTVWADAGEVHDALSSPSSLRGWLRVAGLDAALARDAARLLSLRDALRRLAADATGDQRSGAVDRDLSVDDALAVLHRELPARRPRLCREEVAREGAWRLVWSSVPEGPLGELALAGAELIGGEAGLHACPGPGCVLYFPRSGRREWCSNTCGNRARVARHYQRRKESARKDLARTESPRTESPRTASPRTASTRTESTRRGRASREGGGDADR